jgi:hypothetical protein
MSGSHLGWSRKKDKGEPFKYELASQANPYDEGPLLSTQIPSVKDIVPSLV